nr:N-acetylmuramoyl-L-alanine amidase [Paenibacillus turpanensis]
MIAAVLFQPPAAKAGTEPDILLPECDVLIDAGHGGVDGGTSHGSLLEKHINLEISKYLYEELTRRKMKAALNRTSDYALSDDNHWLGSRSRHLRDLAQRKGLADLLKPKMFVSIHTNWAAGPRDSGPYVLYNKKSEDGRSLAVSIQQNLNKLYGTEARSPVRGRTYYILNRVEQPSVIVEAGFISNPRDRSWLNSKHKQKQIAASIADGIEQFIKKTQQTKELEALAGFEDSPRKKGRPYYERRGYITWDGPRNHSKRIALTFDDGPDEKETEQILDVLQKHQVKATFFIVGKQAEKHPELVLREANEGHELANHTYSHKYFTKNITEREIRDEIEDNQKLIFSITGKMTTYFRPPAGIYNEKIVNATLKAGHRMVLWSWNQETLDWDLPGSHTIANHVVKNAKGGDIVLLHDRVTGKSQTIAALDQLIPTLKEQGYTFVTLSEMLKRSPSEGTPMK